MNRTATIVVIVVAFIGIRVGRVIYGSWRKAHARLERAREESRLENRERS